MCSNNVSQITSMYTGYHIFALFVRNAPKNDAKRKPVGEGMASSERGRPPERSGGEYLTPREAAGILGVTEATVRNMIRRGELDGRQWHTNPGEPRYQATTESVERKAVESKRPPVVRDIDRRTEQVLETLSENFKWIGAEVAQNREMIT